VGQVRSCGQGRTVTPKLIVHADSRKGTLLDTGERIEVRDWFFSDERRIA